VFQLALNCTEKLGYVPTAKELMENMTITQAVINRVGGMRAIRKYIAESKT
jgi:hypothetical protein